MYRWGADALSCMAGLSLYLVQWNTKCAADSWSTWIQGASHLQDMWIQHFLLKIHPSCCMIKPLPLPGCPLLPLCKCNYSWSARRTCGVLKTQQECCAPLTPLCSWKKAAASPRLFTFFPLKTGFLCRIWIFFHVVPVEKSAVPVLRAVV